MRRCNLCAILPVYFVSVVLSRVVACGNDDTGNAAEFTDSKRKLRCRTQGLEQIRFDSVCIQAECCFACEFRRHSSGIVCDGYAFFLSVLGNDVVGKALGCLAYGVDVHAVGTRSDDTAESAGTELKLTVETVFDFCLISFECFQLFSGCLIKIWIIAPFFIYFSVTHVCYPPCLLYFI